MVVGFCIEILLSMISNPAVRYRSTCAEGYRNMSPFEILEENHPQFHQFAVCY